MQQAIQHLDLDKWIGCIRLPRLPGGQPVQNRDWHQLPPPSTRSQGHPSRSTRSRPSVRLHRLNSSPRLTMMQPSCSGARKPKPMHRYPISPVHAERVRLPPFHLYRVHSSLQRPRPLPLPHYRRLLRRSDRAVAQSQLPTYFAHVLRRTSHHRPCPTSSLHQYANHRCQRYRA